MDIEAVLAELIQQPADERADFLAHFCGADETLRNRLERLLGAYQRSGSVLEAPALNLMLSSDATNPIEEVGTVLGPYRLLQQIGEGGMGVVYMADQLHPVSRRVAVKVVKPGMDTKEVVARFEAERQALAMMDHPHIARVFDASQTETGRPYFVMELVKGIPITQFCDEHCLTTRQRLELFIPVCEAVQHAHQKGIIHRDLKPSNVLVALFDGKPVPKVIDFGIAKALNQKLTQHTLFTQFGQLVGTYEYMSPEQAQFNQLDIDTRSDVYSLGVLLYELLTDSPPFSRERLRSAAFDELVRIIREEEPPAPSTRISTSQVLAEIATKRKTPARVLNQLIQGDLDWITMKALEKDRGRRYKTAASFGDDIRRYLKNEPVEACPPSTWYQLRKFAARRRRHVVAATAVLVVMTLGIIATSVAAYQARLESSRANTLAATEKASRAELQRRLYNLRISAAFQSLDDGDLERVERLLRSCVPPAGATDDRGFEWFLLHDRCLSHRPFRTARHPSDISSLSFSPSGNEVVVGIRDGGLVRRNVSDWKPDPVAIASDGDNRWMSTKSIAIDRKSRRLIVGGSIEGGRGAIAVPSQASEIPAVLATFDSPLDDLVVTKEGLAAVATHDGTIHVWDVQRRAMRWSARAAFPRGNRPRPADSHSLYRVAASDQVVAGMQYDSRSIKLWDAQTGESRGTCDLEFPSVYIAFSPDGEYLAVSHVTGIDLFRMGADLEIYFERRIPVRSFRVVFSPDSQQLASGDSFGGISIWDVKTARLVDRIVHTQGVETVKNLAYSPDGLQLTSCDAYGNLRLWDLRRMRAATRLGSAHEGAFHFFAVAHRDNLVAMTDRERRKIVIWNPLTDESSEIGEHPDVNGLAFSHDDRRLATAAKDGSVRVWDVASKQVINEFQHGGKAWSVAFSHDGAWLAAAGEGFARLWDLERESYVELEGVAPKSTFLTLRFAPDDHYLVAGGGDWEYYSNKHEGEVLIWHIETPDKPLQRRMTYPQMVYSTDFSPDGDRLAVVGLFPAILIVDIATWATTTVEQQSWWIMGVVFSPCGTRLVTSSPKGEVTFWDCAALEEIGTLKLHEHVRRVAFLPNAEGLITSCTEGHVRCWRVSSSRK
jgi:WD40 repeat protein/serine/threonine protein kinase